MMMARMIKIVKISGAWGRFLLHCLLFGLAKGGNCVMGPLGFGLKRILGSGFGFGVRVGSLCERRIFCLLRGWGFSSRLCLVKDKLRRWGSL